MLKIHDLRQLSKQAQIPLSAEDLELIDLLTAHIKWAGKYPVPIKGKAELDIHVKQMHAALVSPIPGMSIAIMRRNERLTWNDYSRIWSVCASRYWQLCDTNQDDLDLNP